MQFAVERTSTEGRPALRVVGELDLATAPAFAAAVDDVLGDAPSDLVIDLRTTTFLDSSGCRQLARSARQGRRAGAAVVVVCPPSNTAVRRVLDFLDLQALVPVVSEP